MKHFSRKLGAVFLLSTLVVTQGCGSEQIYTMTETEESAVVDYAARVLSKYNKNQREGVMHLSSAVIDEAFGVTQEPEAEETVSSENTESTESENTTGTTPQAQETTDGQTPQDTSNYISMSNVVNVDGIVAEYGGYDITESYVQEGIYDLPASQGCEILVVHVNLINTGTEGKKVDILNSGKTFAISVNGTTTVKAMTTLLLNDFGTFSGKVKASSTEETVLLFELPQGTGDGISSLELSVTENGVTSQVSL